MFVMYLDFISLHLSIFLKHLAVQQMFHSAAMLPCTEISRSRSMVHGVNPKVACPVVLGKTSRTFAVAELEKMCPSMQWLRYFLDAQEHRMLVYTHRMTVHFDHKFFVVSGV